LSRLQWALGARTSEVFCTIPRSTSRADAVASQPRHQRSLPARHNLTGSPDQWTVNWRILQFNCLAERTVQAMATSKHALPANCYSRAVPPALS